MPDTNLAAILEAVRDALVQRGYTNASTQTVETVHQVLAHLDKAERDLAQANEALDGAKQDASTARRLKTIAEKEVDRLTEELAEMTAARDAILDGADRYRAEADRWARVAMVLLNQVEALEEGA